MDVSDVNFFLRKRYFVCLMSCVGMILIMLLRTNLSIAVVEMTSIKNVTLGNETIIKNAEFNWDSNVKGFVLSVFSIGYLFGPVGGILAIKYGGVTIFGFGLALTATLTVLTPFLIRLNFFLYIIARILEGTFESFTVACTADIFARWAPPKERSRLLMFCVAGAFIGAAINYPLSGFLTYKYGWEAIFFITGGSALIWYGFWFISISNDPTADHFMSQRERDYFKTFTESQAKENRTYPWKKIFTSKQFWVYMNEYFCYSWSASFLTYCLPLYVKDVHNTNIKDIGFISGIPVIGNVVGMAVSAFLLDYLRSKGIFSKFSLHRAFITIGQVSCVICFILIGVWANFEQSIIILFLARILTEFAETSYNVLVIDTFFEYAGIIRGFGVTAISVAYFLNPLVMGVIVADQKRSSWNVYFLFLCIFNIWSLIVFCIYGSSELQEWAAPKTKCDNVKQKTKSYILVEQS